MYRKKLLGVLFIVFLCAAAIMLCLCGCAPDTSYQNAQSTQIKSVPAGTTESADSNVVSEINVSEPELLTLSTKDETSPTDWSRIIHDNETGVDYLMIGSIGSYGNNNTDITVRLAADGNPFVSEPANSNIKSTIDGELSQYYILYRHKVGSPYNIEVVADKTTGVEYIMNTSTASMCPRVDAEGNPLVLVFE